MMVRPRRRDESSSNRSSASNMLPSRSHNNIAASNRMEKFRWVCLAILLIVYYYGSAVGFSPLLTSLSSSVSLRMSVLSSQDSVVSTSSSSSGDEEQQVDEYQYVFWLMPVESDARLLESAIMKDLRDEFDAVRFNPHVTLAPPVAASEIPNPQQALEILTTTQHFNNKSKNNNNLRGSSSNKDRMVTLTHAHADYGFLYTQSVFLQLQSNQELDDLYELSRKVSGLPPDEISDENNNNNKDHFPHLSVLYENCCEQERNQVATAVEQKLQATTLSQQIRFDSVQLIRIQLPVEGPNDVLKWKLVGSAKLR